MAKKEISYSEVDSKLSDLAAILSGTDEEAVKVLERVVPTYTLTRNIACAH